jgi:hypothetical protein
MDNYCAAHPLDSLNAASMALVLNLEDRMAGKKSK